ncbi:dihydrofolate reductase family protein [Chitinophaga sp. 22321]|uniref:Dihydrofolate reductase family protein n=1 Tax=Chitinophaga hostae TaxID=2831022 RepID=A0ABS5J689_9BACT|nr:dihydrofolate reductase family protein [Chitinophaga hostae]MBS0030738.1 dihydrofolate reductase family protein [Chitinophaga hostae]
MRKLKLQMQLSLDGYAAGPNGELDWMTWNFDDQLKEHLNELTDPVDTILLGRKLAEGFIPTWEARKSEPAGEDRAFVDKMNDTHKIVFSRTLKNADWKNTIVTNGNLADEINLLKKNKGGDMIMYGGNDFAANVINENLVDEYNLYIHPVAIGNGLAPFSGKKDLELLQSKVFPCGIVWVQYKSKS